MQAGWKAVDALPATGDSIAGLMGSITDLMGPRLLPMRLRLLLYMIHARLDPSAPHHAYARHCPQKYDDPLWWSEAELSELQGTNLLPAIREQQLQLSHFFDYYIRPLTEACPEASGVNESWMYL